MEPLRSHSALGTFEADRSPGSRPSYPTRPSFLFKTLGAVRGRFAPKPRRTRSMDMLQKPVISIEPHPEAPAPETPVIPRTDSPTSTYSGSSPGTSQGKPSMDVERNARPFPNGFTHPVAHDSLLTVPNPHRRVLSTPLASLSPASMAVAAPPILPSDPDPHIDSLITAEPLEPATETNPFRARATAARAAAVAPTFQSQSPPTPIRPLPPLPSSPTSPSSPTFPSSHNARPRSYTTPQPFASSTDTALDEQAIQHPASLTPGIPSQRPPAPYLASLPHFSPRFSVEGIAARLSPAIITRQPAHPIFTLPPISPVSSPVSRPNRARSQSLRSLPALPMEGSEDLGSASLENAMLDDLDEEEEGMGDEDDEAEDEVGEIEHQDALSDDGDSLASPRSSLTIQRPVSGPNDLPPPKTPPLDMSFLNGSGSGTPRRDEQTPNGSRTGDYFTSQSPASGPSRTPRQFPSAWIPTRNSPVLSAASPTGSVVAAAWAATGPRVLPMPPTPTGSVRPGMYHQTSRSMIDMSEMLKKEQRSPELATRTPKSSVRIPAYEADATAGAAPGTSPPPDEPDVLLGPSLRRQHSMPTFGPSSAPPPYPEFHFGEHGPTIQPRDEEGREGLPRYSNDIYLRAVMPRKMEFTAPGVQARDRKWRRTLCVLEGTAFRVYRCPPAAAGKGVLGNWWEKTVGVGDIAAPPVVASAAASKAKKEREREREARRAKLDGADGGGDNDSAPASPTSPTAPASPAADRGDTGAGQSPPPSASTRSRLLPSNFRRNHRAGSDTSSSAGRSDNGGGNGNGGRRSFSTFRPTSTGSTSGSGSASTSAAASPPAPAEPASPVLSEGPRAPPRSPRQKRRHLWVDDPAVPQPDGAELLRAYALHSAESGLGSDYLKRRNVIRVRMEGQQFLLQAADVAAVVDWIEGFQAATNIALDLDERPMPKGPMFPRRRRRRGRQVASSSTTTTNTS